MTYNIQHGLDANGRYNLQGVVDVIGRLQPDIVGLQEITRNHPSFNCDDQPKLIAEGVSRATGRAWSVLYEREWFTPDRTCLDRGVGSDVETEGLAFLAPNALVSTQSLPLFNTRLAMTARTAETVLVPVIVTHLASGSSGVSDRTAQLAQLLPWATGLGTPRVLIGDFNSQPGASELQAVLSDYRDAWNDAVSAGSARGVMTGDTRVRGGRIDYVFYAPGNNVQVDSAEIVDTTMLLGIKAEVSDHRPLVVRFSMP
jgi:endonuclease/exonuclease/phosphatase family metal-dependent hydrolase